MDIRLLTEEEDQACAEALQLASRSLNVPLPLSIIQVQRLYDTILSDFPEDPKAQITIGIAFGETIVAKAGYEWVRVTDDYGSETALAPVGLGLACYPISMIQKRLNAREAVLVDELRDATIETVNGMISSGKYDKRAG